jgi:hypothetical protein
MKKDKRNQDNTNNVKNNNLRILYAILIIVLVLVIFFFLFRFYQHYTQFRNHQKYFRQPNPLIESWMPVDVVIRDFRVPPEVLFNELKINNTFSNQKLTLDNICKKNNLNCTEVVNNLNHFRS